MFDSKREPALSKSQLGAKIQIALMEGQSPDDSLIVDLVIDAMCQENSKPGGWVLVDFPRTRDQAALLERELTGYEDPKPIKKGDLKRGKDKPASRNKSNIASLDAPGDSVQTAPISGIDAVFLLDIPNETSVLRASGQLVDPLSKKTYHMELDPPPKNNPVNICNPGSRRASCHPN